MLERFRRFLGLERKSLASPDADLLALFGASAQTAAGVAVGPGNALTVPAVSCAVRAISEAAACLDVTVKRREPDGTETEVTDHPVAALLRDGPNDWTDGFTFLRDLVAQALIYDTGGLGWINRVNGRPVEILHFQPGFLTAQDDGTGTGACRYFLNGGAIPAQDTIHLRSPFGRSPLSLARESIGLALTLDAHAARLFGNGARPSGVLSLKERMTPEAIARIRSSWQLAHGAGKSGGTAIVEGGAEYSPLTMTSVDSQFMEMRSFEILQVARAFRVPPQMLYDLSRATWSNAEQMGREFLTYTLEPWLRALEGCLRRALFTPEEFPTHRVAFDRDDLTRASLTERATAINSLISSRVLNPNEGRDWLDLPPRAGGEEYANPNTGSNQPGAAAPQGSAT
ncbi:phage portal protein [Aquabacter sp. L1I39]|nr:phage portal protein [Aquabacter sp. L1I39]